jgi:WD40 repeat protein
MEFDKQEQRTKESRQAEPSHLDERSIPNVPPVLAYLGMGSGGMDRGQNGSPSTQEMQVDQLVAALDSQDWVGRVATVRKLGKFKQDAPITVLHTVLQHDEHQAVRAAAAKALGMIRAESSILSLIAALQDVSWHVRTAAVTALGKQEAAQVPLEPLITALSDEDDSVRTAAAWSIGQLGSRAPLAPLFAALRDSSWQVRESAARSLGKLGAQAAREPLMAALNDKDAQVREAAADALRQIPVTPLLYKDRNTGAIHPVARSTGPIVHDLLLPSNKQDRAPSTGKLAEQEADRLPLPIIRSTKSNIDKQGEDDARTEALPPRRIAPPTRTMRRTIERALVAVLIAAIGLSWLLVSHWPGTTTGSGSTLDSATAFSYQMPSGTATDLVWASPSGFQHASNLVAFATNNGWVQVWNTSNKTLVTTYGPFKKVLALNWPATGLQIAILTNDGKLQLIAAEKMQPVFSQSYTQPIQPLVSLSPDGKRVAVTTPAGRQSAVSVWTLATHTAIVLHPSQPGEITSLAWSSDNSELATASDNGEMRIIDLWSVTRGTSIADPMTVPYVPVPFRVLNMAWSSDNVHLAYALDDGEVRVWDRRSYNHLLFHSTIDQSSAATANWSAVVAWSPDGKHVATTTQHGIVQIWDATTGDLLTTYQGHHQQINALSWSSDGKQISSASIDGLVLVWKAP